MTPILIRAELDPWEDDVLCIVSIAGRTILIPKSSIVTPDNPVTPAMVEAWSIAPIPFLPANTTDDDANRICAQTDWTAMLTALLKEPPK